MDDITNYAICIIMISFLSYMLITDEFNHWSRAFELEAGSVTVIVFLCFVIFVCLYGIMYKIPKNKKLYAIETPLSQSDNVKLVQRLKENDTLIFRSCDSNYFRIVWRSWMGVNWVSTRVLATDQFIYLNTQVRDNNGGFIDFGNADGRNKKIEKWLISESEMTQES